MDEWMEGYVGVEKQKEREVTEVKRRFLVCGGRVGGTGISLL